MGEVTQILSRIETGNLAAAEQLLPLVYEELRKLATQKMVSEAAGHTLPPTALVHEAYIRLVDQQANLTWNSRGHFFSSAAEAMRRILVEHARSKRSLKRGGGWQRVELDEAGLAQNISAEQLVDLDDVVSKLAAEDSSLAELVKLHYFVGMSLEDAARSLNISTATAYRHWNYIRAWLRCELLRDES